jgi:hypothetical protein
VQIERGLQWTGYEIHVKRKYQTTGPDHVKTKHARSSSKKPKVVVQKHQYEKEGNITFAEAGLWLQHDA